MSFESGSACVATVGSDFCTVFTLRGGAGLLLKELRALFERFSTKF